MYYSEWICDYESIRIGFIIHEIPLTYGTAETGRGNGFFIKLRSRQINKRIRPKTRILKISGGKYFENIYTDDFSTVIRNNLKFVSLNQKLTAEEERIIKDGIKKFKICIGKQR